MVTAQDIEATAVGQARILEAPSAALIFSSVALGGHRPFATWCRSIPQRTGHAAMHSSTLSARGATNVVPCSERG
jgi:hypothetical protein